MQECEGCSASTWYCFAPGGGSLQSPLCHNSAQLWQADTHPLRDLLETWSLREPKRIPRLRSDDSTSSCAQRYSPKTRRARRGEEKRGDGASGTTTSGSRHHQPLQRERRGHHKATVRCGQTQLLSVWGLTLNTDHFLSMSCYSPFLLNRSVRSNYKRL